MKAKICHLTSVHHPFDPRIFFKECVSAAGAGFPVTLVAPHDRKESVQGVQVVPLGRFRNRFSRILLAPLKMFFLALKQKARVYHFHDPELIFTGLLLKAAGKRVVFDCHEMVLMDLGDKYWLHNRVLKKIIKKMYRLFESLSVRVLDGYVLAEDGYRDYFFTKYTNFTQKFVILRNYPVLKLVDAVAPGGISKPTGKGVILYAGKLSWNRGIQELIRAAELLKGKVEIWLLGEWENPGIRRTCTALEGWEQVRYLGFMPPEEVYRHMKAADLGICTLLPVPNYMMSLPVKALEYMACSLPMILSHFPYWKEVFAGCAQFVDPQKPGEIARGIEHLLQNPKERKSLETKARETAQKALSWEKEEAKLMALYGRLTEPQTKKGPRRSG